LEIQHITFVEGRGNIIVKYAGEAPEGVISFVGAHMVRSLLAAAVDGQWKEPLMAASDSGDSFGETANLKKLWGQPGK
jgi:hypothetical protein